MKVNKKVKFFVIVFTSLLCSAFQIQASSKHKSKKSCSEIECSKSAKEAKKRYKEAVKRIIEAQPTTAWGDIAREVIAYCAAYICGASVRKVANGKCGAPASAVMHLVVRYLFDKVVRDKDGFDRDLDVLISQKDLDLEGLYAADIDFDEVEKTVHELGEKAEWLRWVVRVERMCYLMVFCFGFTGLTYKGNKFVLIKEGNPKWLTTASVLVVLPLFWYTVVMQSATWKNSTRQQKLDKLKKLLKQAKKEMESRQEIDKNLDVATEV